MKKIFTIAISCFMISGMVLAQKSSGTPSAVPVPVPAPAPSAETIKWEKTSHDFGTVKMGPAAVAKFKFTNTGTTPVTIQTAQASCGCTTPSYTNTPVAPGQSGEVTASYGTDGRPGSFTKSVTVTFINGVSQVLTISGNVSQGEQPAPTPAAPATGGSQQ